MGLESMSKSRQSLSYIRFDQNSKSLQWNWTQWHVKQLSQLIEINITSMKSKHYSSHGESLMTSLALAQPTYPTNAICYSTFVTFVNQKSNYAMKPTDWPINYTRGSRFVVCCCQTILPTSFRVTLLALGASCNRPCAVKATLMRMGKWYTRIYKKQWFKQNKACLYLMGDTK